MSPPSGRDILFLPCPSVHPSVCHTSIACPVFQGFSTIACPVFQGLTRTSTVMWRWTSATPTRATTRPRASVARGATLASAGRALQVCYVPVYLFGIVKIRISLFLFIYFYIVLNVIRVVSWCSVSLLTIFLGSLANIRQCKKHVVCTHASQ